MVASPWLPLGADSTRIRQSGGGSEVEMGPYADGLDIVHVKLSVRRLTVEILQEELEVARAAAAELYTDARGIITGPSTLFMILHVDRNEGTHLEARQWGEVLRDELKATILES